MPEGRGVPARTVLRFPIRAALVCLGLGACYASTDRVDDTADVREETYDDADGGNADRDGADRDGADHDAANVEDGTDLEPEVREVVVAPATSTLAGRCRAEDAAAFLYLAALATLGDGTVVDATAEAAWHSSDESIATVEVGRVTAVAIGSGTTDVEITATYGGVTSAPAHVIVGAECLLSIILSPVTATLAAGSSESVALTATGQYVDGSTADLTELATWASSDETFATVSNAAGSRGVVSPDPHQTGIVQITATYLGITSSPSVITVTASDVITSIEVEPAMAVIGPGTTQSFTATAEYEDGRTGDVTAVASWSSSAPTVATVDARGVATGVGRGNTMIVATLAGQTGTALLTVGGDRVESITVTPPVSVIPVAGTQTLTAMATMTAGPPVNVTASCSWTSATPATATVSPTGVVTGVLAAPAAPVIITCSYAGLTGTATITVSGGILLTINITPAAPPALCGGRTQSFTATGVYSDGSTLDLTNDADLTWYSSNPSAATISNAAGSKGVATAGAIGSTTITARYDDGFTDVTSTDVILAMGAGALVSITVEPSAATVPVGSTVPLTATAHYSCGGDADVTNAPLCVWTSADPAVATVSNMPGSRGIVTGVAPGGPVAITATLSILSGTASVTVVP